jgi:energy-coupling factor transporter transmembrane protein EcfT
MVPSDFMLLGYSYEWWEDMVLLAIILVTVGFLIYSWRYFWTVLKNVPRSLYFGVAFLVLIQYMGENAIVIPESFGETVEELAENAIYIVALVYLWTFTLVDFESRLASRSEDDVTRNNPTTQ